MNPKPAATDIDHASRHTAALTEIIATLRHMLVEELDVRLTAEMVTDDVPLLERGLGLDSIVLYEFITLIEKRFGFEFADQSLDTKVFANLTVLAQHIHDATRLPPQVAAS
ncbi:MAG TPA: phosphopantetheine-binding protein [Kofleriaceae bacterium]